MAPEAIRTEPKAAKFRALDAVAQSFYEQLLSNDCRGCSKSHRSQGRAWTPGPKHLPGLPHSSSFAAIGFVLFSCWPAQSASTAIACAWASGWTITITWSCARELCQANGFGDLAAGNCFDWNHRLVGVWWAAEETGWAYYRPLTVALRTLQLQCFGLNAFPFHLVHLGMYLLSLGLFFGLLRRFGLSLGTAALAILFFVLHPANVVVVCWLANDGPVLVGLWLVLGLWAMSASGEQGHRHPGWLAGVLLCSALAMASRENGVMVGPILVLLDCVRRSSCPGAASKTRRAAVYTLLFAELAIYLAVRTTFLPSAPLPRTPYFHWPWEPGFLAWLPFKVLNELVCLPLGLPFIPIVEVSWWRARPGTAVAAGLVAASLLTLVLADRNRRRPILAIVLGIVLVQAPTALSFSSPYNYYLATAGWGVLLALAVQRWWQAGRRWTLAVPAVLGLVYLGGQWSQTWQLHSAAGTEREVRQAVLATNPRDYTPQRTRRAGPVRPMPPRTRPRPGSTMGGVNTELRGEVDHVRRC